MNLNERIVETAEIKKDGLPKGILARATHVISRFGKRNANNRVYSKELWENTLNDPQIKEKLAKRQMLGSLEHPVDTNLKLNQDISHVISDIRVDEKRGVVVADFDILPTPSGQFINVLHEALCQIGVSTRADGALIEGIDEATGDKYFDVDPKEFKLSTIDYTGDASCQETEAENIIKVTQSHYESKDIEKSTAIALLETVKTNEARLLETKIKEDKQHSDCKCSIGEKKCSGGCTNHIIIGSVVKINEQNGVVLHVFPKTKKAVVQLGIDKIITPISECKLVEEITTEEKVRILEQKLNELDSFSKQVDDSGKLGGSKIKTFQWEEGNLGFDVDVKVQFSNKNDITNTEILDIRVYDEAGNVSLTPTLQAQAKRYIDALDSQQLSESINETIKKTGNEWEVVSHEGKSLGKYTTRGEAVKRLRQVEYFKSNTNEAIKDDINKINKDTEEIKNIHKELKDELAKAPKVNEVVELKIEIPAKIQDFLSFHWDEFINENDAIKQLIKKFAVNDKDASKYVKAMEAGKGEMQNTYTMESKLSTWTCDICGKDKPSSQKKTVIDGKDICEECSEETNESKDKSAVATNLSEGKLNEQIILLEQKVANITAEKNKIAENYAKDMIQATESINELRETANKKASELISIVEEKEKQNTIVLESVVKLNEQIKTLQETNKQDIKLIQESFEVEKNKLINTHKKELVNQYFETKVNIIGLKLPQSTRTLFERCATKEEVDNLINEVRDAIRASSVHYTGINEIRISQTSNDPKMAVLDKNIAAAVKAMG